ncbi:MAG: ZIP family metal transporter [Rhodospirillales bacterium]|nr:ZIP family metal transporter [Rhodospirillales bacterium]
MNEVIVMGLLGSLAAGMCTSLGAIPALLFGRPGQRVETLMLGFAAGVMLAASVFSLIIPGLQAADAVFQSENAKALLAVGGILMGGAALWLIHRFSPHEHFISGPEGADPKDLARIWLFVIAITLHNFPEGMAVGVGFGGGDVDNGRALAIGIGIQNIPEGLAVAAALLTQGYSRIHAFLVSSLTGLVEPVGGLIGASVVSLSEYLLPWGLTFAAGAMIWLISDEIIPETHRHGVAKYGTVGIMIGFVAMMYLDVTLV